MKNLGTPEMTKNCDISIFQAFPIPDLQKVGFVEYIYIYIYKYYNEILLRNFHGIIII